MDREGPFKYVAAYNETTCVACKHLKRDLVISGRSPIHDHRCQHPSVVAEDMTLFGDKDGRHIGHTTDTPNWCPFLQGDEPTIGGKE